MTAKGPFRIIPAHETQTAANAFILEQRGREDRWRLNPVMLRRTTGA